MIELIEEKNRILDLMGHPYCDQFLFLILSEKLDKINFQITELELKTK